MIEALALGLAAAALNTAASRRFSGARRPGDGFWAPQAAAAVFRFAVIFGAAHLAWLRSRRAGAAAAVILIAATAQLFGLAYLWSRSRAR